MLCPQAKCNGVVYLYACRATVPRLHVPSSAWQRRAEGKMDKSRLCTLTSGAGSIVLLETQQLTGVLLEPAAAQLWTRSGFYVTGSPAASSP